MKTLYILIGPKGSGKSFTGKLIEDKLKIPFLRTEKIFKSIIGNRNFSDVKYLKEGYRLLEKEIRTRFQRADALTIESTGITDEFKEMLHNLKKNYMVKLIKIQTDPGLCLKRVRKRKSSDNIKLSDSNVEIINEQAMKVNLDYNLVIDNNSNTDEEIIRKFKTILPDKALAQSEYDA